MVKSSPVVQETQVQSQSQEDLLEKGMATDSSILAWKIPWTEEPGTGSWYKIILGFLKSIYLFIWLNWVLIGAQRIFFIMKDLWLQHTGQFALQHVGDLFLDQGLSLCPLHCKVDS